MDKTKDIPLATLEANKDFTINFLVNTEDGTFKVSVDDGPYVENAAYKSENIKNGIAAIKISIGLEDATGRTTTVKSVTWAGNEAVSTEPGSE